MRAVVQRVSNARVDIDGATAGSIGRGLLILLGVGHDDSEEQAERLWSKIARLRIFEDAEGKTNLSLADVGGEVLVVSQFTPVRELQTRQPPPRPPRRARPTRRTGCTNGSSNARAATCLAWKRGASALTWT